MLSFFRYKGSSLNRRSEGGLSIAVRISLNGRDCFFERIPKISLCRTVRSCTTRWGAIYPLGRNRAQTLPADSTMGYFVQQPLIGLLGHDQRNWAVGFFNSSMSDSPSSTMFFSLARFIFIPSAPCV